MKKLILLCAAFAAATVSLQAQDMIVLRNASAEEIPAKVLEVGDTHIRYRKHSNPDGPIYSVSRSEVFFIRYENGEKEVFEQKETYPADSASAAVGSLAGNGARATAVKRVPLRDRSWEIGLGLHSGLSALFFEEDSWAAPHIGLDLSGNYYFSQYASECLGMSLGFTWHEFMPDGYDESVNLTTLDLDLYFGECGARTSAFGGKVGFSFNFPLGCKMGDYDMGESLNTIAFGMFSNLGWTWKHSDFGLRIQYNFTNTFKETPSSLFCFGLYYGFRF